MTTAEERTARKTESVRRWREAKRTEAREDEARRGQLRPDEPQPLAHPRWSGRDEARVQLARAEAAQRGGDARPRACDGCGRSFPPHLVVDRPGETVCKPCLHLRARTQV